MECGQITFRISHATMFNNVCFFVITIKIVSWVVCADQILTRNAMNVRHCTIKISHDIILNIVDFCYNKKMNAHFAVCADQMCPEMQ